jgi:DNA-binding GntR family transcriptional regulator
MSSDKKELMSEKIYRALSDMIAIHRYEPGLRINVEKLTRELGASRGSVWEAIRRLEQSGVLQNIPNRGVFMAKNTYERSIEQMEAHGALNRLAGRLACKHVTSRLLNRLSRCLKDQLPAIEAGDLPVYSVTDHRFHRLIYEASGNTYLTELFDLITLHLRAIPSEAGIPVILSTLPAIYITHQETIQGLAAKDPDQVDKAILRHEEIIIDSLKQQLQREHERKERVRSIKNLRLDGSASKEAPIARRNRRVLHLLVRPRAKRGEGTD